MARVASPVCDLCGGRKMKRVYVKKSNVYSGLGWVCACDSASIYADEGAKGWPLV